MKNKVILVVWMFTIISTLSMCTSKDTSSPNLNSESLINENKKIIKGCYPVWKHNEYPIDSVPFDQITHLTICFAWPTLDGTLYTSEINDIDNIVLRCHENAVKAVLCIGGSTKSEDFHVISKDSVLRRKFVSSISDYVNDHDIDGVEIDWEYWPTPEKVNPVESKAIVSLFRDLRSSLPNNIALSYDVYSSDWYGKHYPSELINYADEIVIMAFDNTGSWSKTGHHSPPSLVDSSYNYWINRIGKKNKDKVVISTPFYGYNFRNDHTKGNESTVNSISYRDILNEHPEAYLNDTITTDSSVIFHNSIKTFGQKIDFIKKYKLKGVSIWELSFDATAKDKSLLKYINRELNK